MRLLLVVVASDAACTAAGAEETARPNPFAGRSYFYSGVDVARDTSYGWAGAAWSPFGLMEEEGFRLRAQGGGGRYSYRTDDVPGGWNSASKLEGEVLAGWQFLAGGHALAIYGGVNVRQDTLDRPDPSNRDQGSHVGIKGVVEWFYRPAPDWVASAAAGASTADETASARASLGRRLNEHIELGTEATGYTDWFSNTAGAGLYIANPLPGRQWRLAGGWRWSSDSPDGAYGTLSFYAPF
ncbi:cellulose biosynthesis protein BcsS [Ancylobacter oerskovii]|nr:cellulose biosynthesis protein BcsS [Ancylobacter oerskovii]